MRFSGQGNTYGCAQTPLVSSAMPHSVSASRSRLLRAAAVLFVLIASGCAGSPGPTDASTGGASSRPHSTASVKIVEPSVGAQLADPSLHVKLELAGGVIVPQTTKAIKPNEGHIHLSLDGQVVSMAYGLEQDLQAAKGKHLLQAEFVAGDHAPFSPRVIATTPFEVK